MNKRVNSRTMPSRGIPLLLALLSIRTTAAAAGAAATAAFRGSAGGNDGLAGSEMEEDQFDLFAAPGEAVSGSPGFDVLRSSLERSGDAWSIDPLDSESVYEVLRKAGHPKLGERVIGAFGGSAPLVVKFSARPVKKRAAKRGPWRAAVSVGQANSKSMDLTPNKKQIKLLSKLPLVAKRTYRGSWSSFGTVGLDEGSDSKVVFLRETFDEACRDVYQSVRLELALPKVGKEKVGPKVVFTFPMGRGSINPDALVPVSRGFVMVYPGDSGRTVSRNRGGDGINVGKTGLCMDGGPGLVDPQWAKGRKIFWKGRDVGIIR